MNIICPNIINRETTPKILCFRPYIRARCFPFDSFHFILFFTQTNLRYPCSCSHLYTRSKTTTGLEIRKHDSQAQNVDWPIWVTMPWLACESQVLQCHFWLWLCPHLTRPQGVLIHSHFYHSYDKLSELLSDWHSFKQPQTQNKDLHSTGFHGWRMFRGHLMSHERLVNPEKRLLSPVIYFSLHEKDCGKPFKHLNNILATSSFNQEEKKFWSSKTVINILQHSHHNYSKWRGVSLSASSQYVLTPG